MGKKYYIIGVGFGLNWYVYINMCLIMVFSDLRLIKWFLLWVDSFLCDYD